MNTGEKIKKLRQEKGLSQEALGKLVGVQKAAINKYETGRVINIKRDVRVKLAKALGVETWELLDDCPVHYIENPRAVAYKAPDFDEALCRLIDIFDSLNDEGKEKLVEYAEILDFTSLYKKCDIVSEEEA